MENVKPIIKGRIKMKQRNEDNYFDNHPGEKKAIEKLDEIKNIMQEANEDRRSMNEGFLNICKSVNKLIDLMIEEKEKKLSPMRRIRRRKAEQEVTTKV